MNSRRLIGFLPPAGEHNPSTSRIEYNALHRSETVRSMSQMAQKRKCRPVSSMSAPLPKADIA